MKNKSIAVLAAYIFLRLIPDFFFWRNYSPYFAYAFEVAFVAIAFCVLQGKDSVRKISFKTAAVAALAALASGFCIHKLATFSKLAVPFDFSSVELIVLLLVIAPVLEEFIFRLAIWNALEKLIKDKAVVLVAATILFSVGHLMAIWFVPEQYRVFVLYQTMYVTLLGLATGWARAQTKSIFTPVLIHFGFNLGFYFAH